MADTPDPKTLSPLRALTRDELGSLFAQLRKVEKSVEHLPYIEAVEAMKHIDEMRGSLGELLPGGEHTYSCEGCGTPLGGDDNYAAGDDCVVCIECMPADAPQEMANA